MGEDIPQWAKERAVALTAQEGGPLYDIADPRLFARYPEGGYRNQAVVAFARYIADNEEPPVDPLLQEAKALVIADGAWRTANQVAAIQAGNAGQEKVAIALAALKRGMELAREQS